MNAYIRWTIRRDRPEVLAIENASFDDPWDEGDFNRCLSQRNCIGMVAEHDDSIAGFMVYELHKTRLHLLKFAVHPDGRRLGVGRRMIDRLLVKLSHQRRRRITLAVSERNLNAQLFFKACGFVATKVVGQPDDAAYVMEYRIQSEVMNGR